MSVGVLLRYSNFPLPQLLPGNSGLERPTTLDRQAHNVDLDEPAADGSPGSRRLTLTPALQAEVVTRYLAGQSRRKIATALGIGQTTVIKLAREAGVEIRFPRLTHEQCAEICTLYQAGMSQVEIARQVGKDKRHIWHVLERAGLVGRRHG